MVTRSDDVVRLASRLASCTAIDEMTGLANLRLLLRELDRELGRAERTEGTLHVVVIEPEEDSDPTMIAGAVCSVVRREDLVARIGSHRLAIVLSDLSEADGRSMIDGVRAVAGRQSSVRVGVRVVTGEEAAGANPAELIADAVAVLKGVELGSPDAIAFWQGRRPRVQ